MSLTGTHALCHMQACIHRWEYTYIQEDKTKQNQKQQEKQKSKEKDGDSPVRMHVLTVQAREGAVPSTYQTHHCLLMLSEKVCPRFSFLQTLLGDSHHPGKITHQQTQLDAYRYIFGSKMILMYCLHVEDLAQLRVRDSCEMAWGHCSAYSHTCALGPSGQFQMRGCSAQPHRSQAGNSYLQTGCLCGHS